MGFFPRPRTTPSIASIRPDASQRPSQSPGPKGPPPPPSKSPKPKPKPKKPGDKNANNPPKKKKKKKPPPPPPPPPQPPPPKKPKTKKPSCCKNKKPCCHCIKPGLKKCCHCWHKCSYCLIPLLILALVVAGGEAYTFFIYLTRGPKNLIITIVLSLLLGASFLLVPLIQVTFYVILNEFTSKKSILLWCVVFIPAAICTMGAAAVLFACKKHCVWTLNNNGALAAYAAVAKWFIIGNFFIVFFLLHTYIYAVNGVRGEKNEAKNPECLRARKLRCLKKREKCKDVVDVEMNEGQQGHLLRDSEIKIFYFRN